MWRGIEDSNGAGVEEFSLAPVPARKDRVFIADIESTPAPLRQTDRQTDRQGGNE